MTSHSSVWIWINLTFACGGIKVRKSDKVIIDCAPIFKSWIGAEFTLFLIHYQKRNKLIDWEGTK